MLNELATLKNSMLIILQVGIIQACTSDNSYEAKVANPPLKEEQNTWACSDDELDKLLLSAVYKTGFQHPYPSFINRLKASLRSSLSLDSIIAPLNFFTSNLDPPREQARATFYSSDGELLLVYVLVPKDQHEEFHATGTIYDSIQLREIFYFSQDCCVREQFSKGCANMSRGSNNHSPICSKMLEEFKRLMIIENE